MSIHDNTLIIQVLERRGIKVDHEHRESALGHSYILVESVDWNAESDPEALGYTLADVLSDWFEDLDEDCVYRAWERFEGDWYPDPSEGVSDDFWREMEKGFMICGNEIVYEWRQERKHGHPSLTAWERNPGLR